MKDLFCSYCGHKFIDTSNYPRNCINCNNQTWNNPIPVIITLLPCLLNNKFGCIIQKRNIEPKKNEWALPGGYIDNNETWQEAATREVYEELGINTNTDYYKLIEILPSSDKKTMLIFCKYGGFIDEKAIASFTPNSEVSEIEIVFSPKELAFQTHTDSLAKFLKQDEF